MIAEDILFLNPQELFILGLTSIISQTHTVTIMNVFLYLCSLDLLPAEREVGEAADWAQGGTAQHQG